MSKKDEALKLALEALQESWRTDKGDIAITALREALEKAELHKLASDSLTEGLRLDDWNKIGCVNHDCDKCKTLAEQPAPVAKPHEQEPVAWGIIASNTGHICQVELDADEVEGHNQKHIVPLYTSPPAQQEPVPLIIQMLGHCPECGAKAHHFTKGNT